MKKYVVIVTVLIILLNANIIFAESELGFNYHNSQFKFNNDFNGDLISKEVTGKINLPYGIDLNANYNFGNYNNYIDSEIKDLDVTLTKDFISKSDVRLALGTGLNYSEFNTSLFNQELFNIKDKGINLVLELEKGLTDKISLFTDLKYGILGNYSLNSKFLDVGSVTDYKVENNYKLQAGFDFDVTSDLKFKIGYNIAQEKIKNQKFNSINLIVNDDDLADLTNITKIEQGLFFGAETSF